MTDEINEQEIFVRRTAITTAGVSLSMAALSATNILGANDRIRLGVVSGGRQGTDDMQNFMKHGVEVAAVCDVYQPNLDKCLAAAGGNRRTFKDFRQVLDEKNIDVVLVGPIPDHWHPLPMIEACEAGKDVYVRSPFAWQWKTTREDGGSGSQVQPRGSGGSVAALQCPLPEGGGVGAGRVAGQVSFVRTWNYGNSIPRAREHILTLIRPPGSIWTSGWGRARGAIQLPALWRG